MRRESPLEPVRVSEKTKKWTHTIGAVETEEPAWEGPGEILSA